MNKIHLNYSSSSTQTGALFLHVMYFHSSARHPFFVLFFQANRTTFGSILLFFCYDKFGHAVDACSAILESNCSFIDSCSRVKAGGALQLLGKMVCSDAC